VQDSLPDELRKDAYKYCMDNGEEKALEVVQNPGDSPRRSIGGVATTTNFAYSYWAFTQACQQVRQELTS
jgi:hypothetical protein